MGLFSKKKDADRIFSERQKYINQVINRKAIVDQIGMDGNIPLEVRQLYSNNYQEELEKVEEVQLAIEYAKSSYKTKLTDYEIAKQQLIEFASQNVDWDGTVSYARKGTTATSSEPVVSVNLMIREENARHADIMKQLNETILIAKCYNLLATPLPAERTFSWTTPRFPVAPAEKPKATQARKPKRQTSKRNSRRR